MDPSLALVRHAAKVQSLACEPHGRAGPRNASGARHVVRLARAEHGVVRPQTVGGAAVQLRQQTEGLIRSRAQEVDADPVVGVGPAQDAKNAHELRCRHVVVYQEHARAPAPLCHREAGCRLLGRPNVDDRQDHAAGLIAKDRGEGEGGGLGGGGSGARSHHAKS